MTKEEAMNCLAIIYERSRKGERAYHNKYQDAFDMAIEALKGPQWIPCGERLPEVHWFDRDICYSDTVLVTEETKYGSKDVKMGYRTTEGGGEIWWDAQEGAGFAGEIIAWMPLPEPY